MFKHKNGKYYSRIHIPKNLRPWFNNKSEHSESLKTKSRNDAVMANSAIEVRWQEVFFRLHHKLVEQTEIFALVEQLIGPKKQSKVSQEFSPKASLTPFPIAMTLTQLVKVYTAEHLPRWTPKTSLEFESIFRLIVLIFGDVPILTFDRKQCIALRDILQKIPPGHSKAAKYRNLSIDELIASEGAKLHPKTVNKHLQLLSGMFRWSVRHRYMEHNPAEGLSLEIKKRPMDERQMFCDDDIQRIYSALPPAEKEPTSWIPIVGMYSGLRLEEICKLRRQDIILMDGVHLFDINNYNGNVKTRSSVRFVPIHQCLIEMGFLEYVSRITADCNLWGLRTSRYGYGKMYGKKFGWFLRKHAKINNNNKCFHSLRHSFAFKLKIAGVDKKLIGQLMGHADEDISTGRYGEDFPTAMAAEAVNRIVYIRIEDSGKLL